MNGLLGYSSIHLEKYYDDYDINNNFNNGLITACNHKSFYRLNNVSGALVITSEHSCYVLLYFTNPFSLTFSGLAFSIW